MSGFPARDPAAQHRAAAEAGMMAALGLVEGAPLLRAIRRAAIAAAPGRDRLGLAMRLAHTFEDAQAAARLGRALAGRRIAAALAPLLEARAPGEALLRAAAGADPDGVLTDGERRRLVEAVIRRRLRGVRR